MIAHKVFTRGKGFYMGRGAVRIFERLRQEAQAFISKEGISDEDVISVTESWVNTAPSVFQVTVWYRKT